MNWFSKWLPNELAEASIVRRVKQTLAGVSPATTFQGQRAYPRDVVAGLEPARKYFIVCYFAHPHNTAANCGANVPEYLYSDDTLDKDV